MANGIIEDHIGKTLERLYLLGGLFPAEQTRILQLLVVASIPALKVPEPGSEVPCARWEAGEV
jgi:hypothetical protein